MAETPTTVRLADGSSYTIPTYGTWGTFTWARQASLISVAYRQIGNEAEALKWDREYARRRAIWDNLEAGRDKRSILLQFGEDLITAPFEIVAAVGNQALKTAGQLEEKAFDLVDFLTSPWLWAGLIVGAVLIFSPVGAKLIRKVA